MVVVMKIGGSLMKFPVELRSLMRGLVDLANDLLIVPGGGAFADVVRDADRTFKISDELSHRMAILGMDQYGLLLHSLVEDRSKVVYDTIIDKDNLLTIILPSQLMLKEEELEHSWRVTSDSIAAYIAHLIDADRLILVKDVDGIFDMDPKKNVEARLFRELSARDVLLNEGYGCVDPYLPKLLLKYRLVCVVVNGLFVDRVVNVVKGESTLCTVIDPNF
ncbi:MAG: hypothetical protein RMJ31_02855 [Nitrososphaerota archaeon]|nr:hypothetical protein [Nitrososphaerales archaeon]MDW8044697.1 hypothetical protein [Nitrososphaerota archaeon]